MPANDTPFKLTNMKLQRLISLTFGTLAYRKEILGQDIGWMQEGFKEVLNSVCSALVRSNSDNVILSGCEVNIVGGNTEVSAGYIYSKAYQEILRLEADTLAGTGFNVYVDVIERAAPFGTVRFADGIIRQAHIDRVFMPLAGNGPLGVNAVLLEAMPKFGTELAYVIDAPLLLSRFSSEAWHYIGTANEPVFESGWLNHNTGSGIAFKKDVFNNRIHLRGHMSAGAFGGATFFTLPAGYRPMQFQRFGAWASYTTLPSEMARIIVNTNGAVGIYALDPANITMVSLDGLSFPLD